MARKSKLLKRSAVHTRDGERVTTRGRPRKTDEVAYVAKSPEDQIAIMRELCKTSFYDYIRIVAPYAVMGMVHKEFCDFLQHNPDHASYLLGLLPRGHRKSFIIGMYCCWRIMNPGRQGFRRS